MDTILLIVIALLSYQLLFVLWNLATFPSLKKSVKERYASTRLSVLIPARNEERNIKDCLNSVLKQTHLPDEILVLNDHSTDQTKAILEQIMIKQSRVKVVEGVALPLGWMGKSFACQQLADHAKGDWLVFLDADARLEKDALEKLLPLVDKQQTGIISGFPRQILGTWMEKLVVTMMQFVIISHLPIRYVQKAKSSLFAAAHGAFILVNKESYQKVGGHEAIKSSMLDDMQLMKRFKLFGYPATLVKIDQVVNMRMYRNAKEVWQGYQKNLFAGLNRNVFLFVIIFSYYTFLYILLWVTLLFGGSFIYVCVAYGLAVITKIVIDLSNQALTLASFLLPVSVILMLAIATDSLRISYLRRGYVWKGRRYL
ncbi:glycosyltransferase family 2 protein [Paraliobacillus sp. X-1268]|uniref:glycosyltransferase n=1 Tax=Paraliobacillus sp. X-1268 TaxID=2213193 RepID=UPI000E3D76CE|nr:glycosyltransferase family 2 protein [Paraliobacillus sp. X-1268]